MTMIMAAGINTLAKDITINRPTTGSANAIVRVNLSAPTTNLVTVHYASASGFAEAGKDFLPVEGDLAFKPGETTGAITIVIPARTDLLPSQQSFVVRLTEARNALLTTPQVFVTVSNTQPAAPSSITPAEVTESASGTNFMTFTVTLPQVPASSVVHLFYTLPGTATPGVDYEAITGQVWSGAGETNATVRIPVFGDLTPEPDETFYLVVGTNPSTRALGTIIDDDTPRISDIQIIDRKARVTFPTLSGVTYEIQFKDSIENASEWKSLTTDRTLVGTGAPAFVTDDILPDHRARFYRIRELP